MHIILSILFFILAEPLVANPKIPEDGLDKLTISLWTIKPGALISDRWGHNALRFRNTDKRFDFVYNWGTYNFDEPYFYLGFVSGRLQYTLAALTPKRMTNIYRSLGRSVTENKIKLDNSQKLHLIRIINKNVENPKYRYHYRLDNCSTRIRDYLNEVLNGDLKKNLEVKFTTEHFRDYIRSRLRDQPFIVAALGTVVNSNIDQPMNHWELSFLPENFQTYLKQEFDNLLERDRLILDIPFSPNGDWRLGYLCLGGLHLVFLIWYIFGQTKLKFKHSHRALYCYSSILTSSLSLFMCYIWAASDHIDGYHNALLFVLWPIDFIFIFSAISNTKFYRLASWTRLCLFGFLILGLSTGLIQQDVWFALLALGPLVLIQISDTFLAFCKRIKCAAL